MNRVPKLRFSEFSGEWEKKKLENITIKVGSGKTPKGGREVYTDKGVLFIRSQNVLNNGLKLGDVAFITLEENEKMKSSQVLKGDVLLNITGASIGRSCIFDKELIQANVNQHVCIIRPNNNTNSSFLQNNMISSQIQNQIDSFQAGGNREGLNFEEIRNMKIFIPSLPEQEEIATFLSSVDSKIEKLERKKALWEQYKKGMMQKIFSQELRFKNENGEDYPEWEEKFIGDIFQISAGGDIKSENTSEVKTEDFKYPIYANSDKNKGLFGYSNIYKQKGNCVTVTGRGNLGVAVARYSNFYPIVRLLVLRPKQDQNIKFFEEAINNLEFLVESTGVPQLTGPQISSYLISYPSLPEQIQIADFLSSIDSKIEITDKELIGMKEFKKGLLQQMFV